ncbi:MAG: LacI family DNA-binding transcriptional regulator [Bacteroidales bacterium]|nr:LacI family DNA-binding transcriptional regulator [Bacteroidales bacterium]
MKKYSTIKDIANALNISTATVSRALADRCDVNQETKNKVLEEAKRQNYRPNPIALRLQNKRSKTIGLVVPEFKSSFFPMVIAGIQKVMDESGFQLLITESQESMEVERRNLKLLENNMVEGILISITREGENFDLYQELIDSGIPLVFFNRVSTKVVASKVVIDDYRRAFFATEHLIYSGFKKIYHFSGPKNLIVSSERKRGFVDAMKKHHFEITDNSIMTAGVFMDKGFSAMQSLIDKNDIPEAIFCFNDPTALGALKAIKEAGLKCPEDVALVGFSETEIAQLVDPPLTSVEQPTFEMGETAARLLLKQITQTPPPEVETICLLAKLNIRKSSINTHKG